MAREHTFELMGTTAHVIVHGGDPHLITRAVDGLRACHERWTRFDPNSELSRVNDNPGRFTIVSESTYQLVAEAVAGWWRSGGAYDPTVIDVMAAHGYDRTFDEIEPEAREHTPPSVPGCSQIALLGETHAVFLPKGVRLDLGGIAKGFAADLVVADLMIAGATGACVNIGGDAAFDGAPPTTDGWLVEVAPASRATGTPRTLALGRGAICTSSTQRRRWRTDRGERHHLIDPRTAAPAGTGITSVTVLAGRAVDAEVAAKEAILLSPTDAIHTLSKQGLAGVIVTACGSVLDVGPIDQFAA